MRKYLAKKEKHRPSHSSSMGLPQAVHYSLVVLSYEQIFCYISEKKL